MVVYLWFKLKRKGTQRPGKGLKISLIKWKDEQTTWSSLASALRTGGKREAWRRDGRNCRKL